MEVTVLEYPKFYRKGCLCLKRESDTTTVEILIPVGDQDLPLSHQRGTYPSKARLDEEVFKMEKVDQDDYEGYLGTFFKTAEKNRVKFNDYRQKRFEQNNKAI